MVSLTIKASSLEHLTKIVNDQGNKYGENNVRNILNLLVYQCLHVYL